MNCPICEKSGLPDYTITEIVCPQCNSDLTGYVVLRSTKKIYHKTLNRQRVLFISIIVFLVLCFTAFAFFNSNSIKDSETLIIKNEFIIDSLQIKIQRQNEMIAHFESSKILNQEKEYLYIIKNGDNLSKIAYLFYNDWEKYKNIEYDNNLEPGSLLFPGDTLIIKLGVR